MNRYRIRRMAERLALKITRNLPQDRFEQELGGGGERATASFISPSDRQQNSFGMGTAAQNSAIVDWSKPATEQPGYTAPLYGGRADPGSP